VLFVLPQNEPNMFGVLHCSPSLQCAPNPLAGLRRMRGEGREGSGRKKGGRGGGKGQGKCGRFSPSLGNPVYANGKLYRFGNTVEVVHQK